MQKEIYSCLLTWNALVLSMFAVASSHAAPRVAPTAQPNEEKQIKVRIRNYARMDSGILLKSEATANRILREAGAETVWVVCFDGSTWSGDVACTNPPGPMDLTVNVLPFSRTEHFRHREDVFGCATEDGEYGFAGLAWIFYDPIKSFAIKKELSFVHLLGHVFAHELGHMLLGSNSHSEMGLMRAPWSSRELRAAERAGLFFSASESRRIQKAVLARWQADSRGVQTTQGPAITKIQRNPEPE